MLFKYSGVMGYSISPAISVNKLTSESCQMVLVMIFCGEFVSGCTIPDLAECSNFLVHCRTEKYNLLQKHKGQRLRSIPGAFKTMQQ